jgi:hypothetical protein
MSVLKLGYSSADIKQFVQQPVTIEADSPIRFTDANGNLETTLGFDASAIQFKTTGLAIADDNAWRVYANGSTGVVRFWVGPNGLATSTTGIDLSSSPVTSVTLTPGQMVTLCGNFTRGIFLVNYRANLYDTGASPIGVNMFVRQDPAGANVVVGQAFSEVGSDSGRNFGNYWSVPFQFVFPLTSSVDVTKSYQFQLVSGGEITQIQFVPLY